MRISIVSSKNAKNIYIIESFRKNGKSTTKIHKKLGTVEQLLPQFNNDYDALVAWAKDQATVCTELLKQEKQDLVVTYPSKQLELNHYSNYNGGYLFIQSIFYELKLDILCQKIQSNYQLDYDLTTVLSLLIYCHYLYPTSTQTYQRLSASLLEEFSIDVVKTYQALEIITKEKNQIELFLYKQSKHLFSIHHQHIHLLHTNHVFENDPGYRVRKYDKEFNPTSNVYYFVDENHLPLTYFTQNIHMNRTLFRQIIEDFKDAKLVVTQDSLFPSETINALKDKPKETITIQAIKDLPTAIIQWIENYNGWFINGSKEPVSLLSLEEIKDGYYYKERTIDIDNTTKRIIALYNPKIRQLKQDKRQANIQEIKHLLSISFDNKSKTEKANPKSNFIELVDKDSFYDGIIVLTTTTSYDIPTLIYHYNYHSTSESVFSNVKHDTKTRTIFLSKESRANVHFTTNFLCLYFDHLLKHRLEYKYTSQQIKKTLRDMKFKKIDNIGYLSLYTRTEISDALHNSVDYRLDNEIISIKKMDSIIQQSKKRKNTRD